MDLSKVCTSRIISIPASNSVVEAAQLMYENHTGTVVVLSNESPREPVGILTDRDIAIRMVAFAGQRTVLSVEEIMSKNLVTVPASTGIFEAIQLMKERGVRRLLVTDTAQELVGIVSLDDLLPVLADEMTSLAQAIAKGLLREETKT